MKNMDTSMKIGVIGLSDCAPSPGHTLYDLKSENSSNSTWAFQHLMLPCGRGVLWFQILQNEAKTTCMRYTSHTSYLGSDKHHRNTGLFLSHGIMWISALRFLDLLHLRRLFPSSPSSPLLPLLLVEQWCPCSPLNHPCTQLELVQPSSHKSCLDDFQPLSPGITPGLRAPELAAQGRYC